MFANFKDLYSGQSKSYFRLERGAKFSFVLHDKRRAPELDLRFEKRRCATPQGKYEIYVIQSCKVLHV